MLFTYLKLLFPTKFMRILFNKKKTKNKYRKSTYKEISIYFSMHKSLSYYSFFYVLNCIISYNYIGDYNSVDYALISNSIRNFNSKIVSVSYNTITFGIYNNSIFKMLKPYIIYPLEFKTLMKHCFQKSYSKFNIASQLFTFPFYIFFLYNLYPKSLYPFLIYNN